MICSSSPRNHQFYGSHIGALGVGNERKWVTSRYGAWGGQGRVTHTPILWITVVNKEKNEDLLSLPVLDAPLLSPAKVSP